ncbi:MAG: hypothetical protein M0T78_00665 [Actinomycetota bacterium]|nr:hypothetical protein [Actinomycetota bacterium]
MDLSRYSRTELPPLGDLLPFRATRFDTSVGSPIHLVQSNIDEYLVEDEELSIYIYEISNRTLKIPVRIRLVAVAKEATSETGTITLFAVEGDVASLPFASAIGPISRMGDTRGQLHRIFVVPSPSVIEQVVSDLAAKSAYVISKAESGGPGLFEVLLFVSEEDLNTLSDVGFSSNQEMDSNDDEQGNGSEEQAVIIEPKLLYHPPTISDRTEKQ